MESRGDAGRSAGRHAGEDLDRSHSRPESNQPVPLGAFDGHWEQRLGLSHGRSNQVSTPAQTWISRPRPPSPSEVAVAFKLWTLLRLLAFQPAIIRVFCTFPHLSHNSSIRRSWPTASSHASSIFPPSPRRLLLLRVCYNIDNSAFLISILSLTSFTTVYIVL